jgi:hypothetical protein
MKLDRDEAGIVSIRGGVTHVATGQPGRMCGITKNTGVDCATPARALNRGTHHHSTDISSFM